jgi:hypothetical protein
MSMPTSNTRRDEKWRYEKKNTYTHNAKPEYTCYLAPTRYSFDKIVYKVLVTSNFVNLKEKLLLCVHKGIFNVKMIRLFPVTLDVNLWQSSEN